MQRGWVKTRNFWNLKRFHTNTVTLNGNDLTFFAKSFIIRSWQNPKFDYNIDRIRLNYATTHHHPQPPITIHHRPPPPTTSQNIPTTIHHHPTTAKTSFIRNPFIRMSRLSNDNVRNLTSRPAIAKKLFYMALSIIFATYTRNSFRKLQCEQTITLCETSLVLKKTSV